MPSHTALPFHLLHARRCVWRLCFTPAPYIPAAPAPRWPGPGPPRSTKGEARSPGLKKKNAEKGHLPGSSTSSVGPAPLHSTHSLLPTPLRPPHPGCCPTRPPPPSCLPRTGAPHSRSSPSLPRLCSPLLLPPCPPWEGTLGKGQEQLARGLSGELPGPGGPTFHVLNRPRKHQCGACERSGCTPVPG